MSEIVNERRLIALIITSIISSLLIGIGVFVLSDIFKIIPSNYLLYIFATIWFIAAILVSYFISNLIRSRLGKIIGYDNASSVSFIAKLIGYIIAFIGFFVVVKVSIGTALAAGGFAGVGLSLRFHEFVFNLSSSFPLFGSPRLG